MDDTIWKHGEQPGDIPGLDLLVDLALDLRSEWHHGTDFLWRSLDADRWESTRNPWVVLQAVSRRRLEAVLGDPQFRRDLGRLIEQRHAATQRRKWFRDTHGATALDGGVAYFSMEFMLSEALPIYSGGLGNVAGDLLKTANDLGVPVTGVGLLYQRGYFHQIIDPAGDQLAAYPYNDPGQLPVTPLREASGEWLRVKLALPGHVIWVRAWQARIGGVKLYLLDTNDIANHPPYRAITSELYGGGPDMRLLQEMVLGIGGWRLLRALGAEPAVCHLNEGHAALLVLERARSFMLETGQPFEVALAATRAGNVFTTHTAVPAGFDCYTATEMAHGLHAYAERELGIAFAELLALGRREADNAGERFAMAHLAIRGSAAVNAVSRLHGAVSRQLFAPLFPRWPLAEIPIGHVTNGVHMPTWDSAAADALWTRACGQHRWLGETDGLACRIRTVSDAELWRLRVAASAAFVEFVRRRLDRHRAEFPEAAVPARMAGPVLDPGVLTLGFARRFATYKRPDLLLHDRDRLARLLNDAKRPLQLVLAGKAHPADKAGQALIREWIGFAQRPEAAGRVVFLDDYDMHLAEQLVQGVDVWLNTPRRPWEASGTSGMKVLVNGGINLSVLDGWWAEAYAPEVGWTLPGAAHSAGDAAEAGALYDLLEHEVAPAFYARDAEGIPRDWVARIRNSMAELTPRFSSNRALREYVERYYLPAARGYRERAAGCGALAARLVQWRQALDRYWHEVRFGAVQIRSEAGRLVFEVELAAGGLGASALQVEIYADPIADGATGVRQPMTLVEESPRSDGMLIYRGAVPAERAAGDYTVRAIAHQPHAALPLEAPHIVWQR